MLVIKQANETHIPVILQLIKGIAEYEKMLEDVTATEERLHNSLLVENTVKALMAELDGVCVGYMLYFYNFSSFTGTKGLYLEDVFVLPQHRSKGIGKALFKELFAIAAVQNCARMEWVCLHWNEPSKAIYRGFGAKELTEWGNWRLERDDIIRLAAE